MIKQPSIYVPDLSLLKAELADYNDYCDHLFYELLFAINGNDGNNKLTSNSSQ